MALMTAWTHDCPVYLIARRAGAAMSLGFAGLGSQKIPENESEHGQDDHQHRPENFLARIRAALKDIDDRPDIGDQNDETEQTLVLHLLSPRLFLSARLHLEPRHWDFDRLEGGTHREGLRS